MSPKVKILKRIFPLFPNKWTAIIVLVNSNIKTQIHIPKTHFNITVTEESLACFEKWKVYVGFLFQRELVPRMSGFILYNIMQRKTLHSRGKEKDLVVQARCREFPQAGETRLLPQSPKYGDHQCLRLPSTASFVLGCSVLELNVSTCICTLSGSFPHSGETELAAIMCVRSASPCLKSLNITSRRKAHFSPNRGKRFQANLHTPCTVTVPLVFFCVLLQQLSQYPWTHSASFFCSDFSP